MPKEKVKNEEEELVEEIEDTISQKRYKFHKNEQRSRDIHQVGDKNTTNGYSINPRRMSGSLYIIDWSKSIRKRLPVCELEEDSSSLDSDSSLDERCVDSESYS